MKSKYFNQFNMDNPLNEYPRPQLKRDNYILLNGRWDLAISKSDDINVTFDKTIIVPYCVESYLSGINQTLNDDEYLIYHKKIDLSKIIIKDKIILHFGAVDCHCKVYINKQLVIENNNGYLPFEVDIKPYVKENDNEIIVVVKDNLDTNYPYGKQSKKRGNVWYTPVSGIWQSVWLESVSFDYIENLTIKPDIDNNNVRIIVHSSADEITLSINENKKTIYSETKNIFIFDIKIDNMHLWSPEDPFLYDLEIKTKNDVVKSYFAMRKFSTNEKYFLLNNKPYFINGLLDQGYFPDGIYTPASYQAYQDDILTMKKLGYNCLRKHIKIEPAIYYYYCDIYGMLVFQDMVNSGTYSFFIDTALPNIGLKQFALSFKNFSSIQKENFKKAVEGAINLLYNYPCVVYYTIFNEGWGQHEADHYYHLIKEFDDSRIVDSTSGWFKETDSDVESLHIYIRNIKINNTKSYRPIILSEFGGYSYQIKDHVFSKNQYGYKKYRDLDSLNNAIYKLYTTQIIPNIKKGLAGCIYTQVSDVEDEINGLLTYDREILKVDISKMNEIKKLIEKEFYHD